MKTMTENDATNKMCPFFKKYCHASNCMAWDTVHPEVKRENHPGGKEFINDLIITTYRTSRPRLEGPNNCDGVWVLDAEGCCRRLYPEKQ